MSKCREMLSDHGKIIDTLILRTKCNLALFERFAFPRSRQVANTRSRNICATLGVLYSLSHILVFSLLCLSQNSQFSCFVFILIAIFAKIVFLSARLLMGLISSRLPLIFLSVIRSCVLAENSVPSFTSKKSVCFFIAFKR